MSTGDWIALAALIIPSVGGFAGLLKWFGNHSERLRTAEAELEARPEFAHVVINDRLEDATDQLVEIVRSVLAADNPLTGR